MITLSSFNFNREGNFKSSSRISCSSYLHMGLRFDSGNLKIETFLDSTPFSGTGSISSSAQLKVKIDGKKIFE
jgi:hypothetical protein